LRLLDEITAAQPRPAVSTLARFGLTNRAVDQRDLIYGRGRFGREGVEESEDLERIRALARRPRPSEAEQQAAADEMTARLTRGPVTGCKCAQLRPTFKNPCITRFLPIQGWYLLEASKALGAIGHITAGRGKTGIDIMLPLVVPDCRRAVLMIPPNLRRQFATDYLIWSQHFRVPNLAGGPPPHTPGLPVLDVIAYSELSAQGWATWLKTSGADILIGDEAQNLKDKNSARTDRFLRFYIDVEAEVEAGRATRVPYFFAHSGTLTEASCDEYGHLSALALREQSPLPIDTGTLGQWCEALDPGPGGSPRRAIGALAKLCSVGETARTGFRRRLVETLGVITTEDAELACRLRMHERPVEVPPVIKNAIAWVKTGKQRPDGEMLEELSQIAAVCRQLAAGFFYIWRYPRGESEELIDRWLTRRSAWAREVRERLESRSDLLDSPGLLELAARRALGLETSPGPSIETQTYQAWLEVKDLVQPVTDTVWIDEFLARDAACWAAEAPGVVWYGHDAYGRRVSELANAPLYESGDAEPQRLNPTPVMLERRAAFVRMRDWEGGDVADNWLKCEDGSRSIVASIKAHGTGKNMQAWRRALVSNPPVKGWEQLLARLHRQGQEAESVDVFVYRHTAEVREAFEKARENATFVFETTGRNERLLFAEYGFKP
jgi:hypothetical protein